MKNNWFCKLDQYFKTIILFLAQITIIAFAITTIFFLSLSDQFIKLNYDQQMQEIVYQTKNWSKIGIWFFIPLSLLIIFINGYKTFNWLYEKKQQKLLKKQKRGKFNV